jgi:CheY-like chemotaxis protein
MSIEINGERRSARILVVDDNEAAAKVLSLLLSIRGYDIREAHNGAQALRIAQSFVPDVVLLDIGMPILDGFEVARSLREMPGLDRMVLIAVTGRSGNEWLERTRAAGFQHHLVKSGEPDEILRLLVSLGMPAKEEDAVPRLRSGASS